MKKLLFLPFILSCLLLHGQTEDIIPDNKSQIKITSSIEYKKLPFAMRMLKKQLPKEDISYYAQIGQRNEVNIEMKILGKTMMMSTISVTNYKLGKVWSKELMIVNDSIVKDGLKTEIIELTEENSIIIGAETKEILGYPCVAFSMDTDSFKMEGFLAPGIMGPEEFRGHGMPLEIKATAKTEKIVQLLKATSIEIEPLNSDLFKLEKN